MTPPELTGNAPVSYVVKPVHIHLSEAVGYEAERSVFVYLYGGLCQLVHPYEPLELYHRLNDLIASFMHAYGVSNVLNAYKKPQILKFLNNELPCLVPVHTLVFSAVGVDRSVIVEDVDLRKVMAFAHLIVVRIVGGCYFNYAGTEFHINVGIAYDGNFLVDDGQNSRLSDEMLISVVRGINGNGRISEHGFRTCGGKLKEIVRSGDGIFYVPEMSGHIDMVDFRVGNCCLAFRAPVYELFSPVDIAFVIEADERLKNGL